MPVNLKIWCARSYNTHFPGEKTEAQSGYPKYSHLLTVHAVVTRGAVTRLHLHPDSLSPDTGIQANEKRQRKALAGEPGRTNLCVLLGSSSRLHVV